MKVKCPKCGKVEVYEPDEEILKRAMEIGLASISFYHGDHVLVACFDSFGTVRGTSVVKVVSPLKIKPMPLQDVVSLIGVEGLAILLTAIASEEKVLLLSHSDSLTRGLLAKIGEIVRPVKILTAWVEEPNEALAILRSHRGMATIIGVPRVSYALVPSNTLILKVGEPYNARKDEKKALKYLIKVIKSSLSLIDEYSRVALLNNTFLRLKKLIRDTIRALIERRRISKSELRALISPNMHMDELDLVLFALNRFRGINIKEYIITGVEEFFMPI